MQLCNIINGVTLHLKLSHMHQSHILLNHIFFYSNKTINLDFFHIQTSYRHKKTTLFTVKSVACWYLVYVQCFEFFHLLNHLPFCHSDWLVSKPVQQILPNLIYLLNFLLFVLVSSTCDATSEWGDSCFLNTKL